MAGVVYIRSLLQLLKLPVISSVSDSADESSCRTSPANKNDRKKREDDNCSVYISVPEYAECE